MTVLIRDIITNNSEAVFDKKKLQAIIETYHNFINKNEDHVAYFGGCLIGVNPIRWRDEDTEHLIDELCEIVDYDGMREELWSVSAIEQKRHVSGNPLNYMCPWLLYQVYNCKVDNKVKELALEAAMNLFQLKFMTGIDKRFFKYVANQHTALATYEGLTNKSLIKRFGNWKGVVEYRSRELLSNKSVYLSVVRTQADNVRLVEFVNDIQGRCKSTYKNITRDFYNAKDTDAKIMAQSSYSTIDGEKTMREFESNISKYVVGIKDILNDPHDFIKDELIDETIRIIETCSITNLRTTLEFISDNIGGRPKLDMQSDIEELVLYLFAFIQKSGLRSSDIPIVISKLRNIYRSHKATHNTVVNIKDHMGYIVSKAIKAKHDNTRSATKVAALVYITLRILSIPYYNA